MTNGVGGSITNNHDSNSSPPNNPGNVVRLHHDQARVDKVTRDFKKLWHNLNRKFTQSWYDEIQCPLSEVMLTFKTAVLDVFEDFFTIRDLDMVDMWKVVCNIKAPCFQDLGNNPHRVKANSNAVIFNKKLYKIVRIGVDARCEEIAPMAMWKAMMRGSSNKTLAPDSDQPFQVARRLLNAKKL